MDEVQLMGVGRTTSVQLQHFFENERESAKTSAAENFPGRRTLWMSATLGLPERQSNAWPSWAKTPEIKEHKKRPNCDRPPETELDQKKWRAPKRLEWRKDWNAESDVTIDEIIKAARGNAIAGETERSKEGRTVLIVLNTVARAREIHRRLSEKLGASDYQQEPLLLHSRFRPKDRERITAKLIQESPRSGRIIVSTQVLEAGVDLDADALFTEICPWPSLVQRLGRLNRCGEKPNFKEAEKKRAAPARAVVFDLPAPPDNTAATAKKASRKKGVEEQHEKMLRKQCAPYDPEDINGTRERLKKIGNGGDLSPSAISRISFELALEGPVLRRFQVREDFFGTDADLSGGHTDVSPHLRALDRDLDAYILWRRLSGEPSVPAEEQPPPHRDELCAVPFFEAREAFSNTDIWILAYSTERGRRTVSWCRARANDIRVGDTVMLDVSAGGYKANLGWLGKNGLENKPDTWIERVSHNGKNVRAWMNSAGQVIEVVDERVEPEPGLEGDSRSFRKRHGKDWMTLPDHLLKAELKAQELVSQVGLDRCPEIANAVVEADRWHDVGKALERDRADEQGSVIVEQPFQIMLRQAGKPAGSHPVQDQLYAKSNGSGGSAGFRHEVASALAYLKADPRKDKLMTSLVAYLILAHHGKVRLMPSPWDDETMDDANGVRPADRVPPLFLAGRRTLLGQATELDIKDFLPARNHPGWQGRVAALLDAFGPFYLAWLEALVRIADWRAS
jgi:CRISPR-associated endonuclease/helicase Cas3